MRFYAIKTDDGLVPYGESDYEIYKRLPRNKAVAVDVKEERNIDFHNKYIKLIRMGWEHLKEGQTEFFYRNFDIFRKTIELSAGCCEKCYSTQRNEWIDIPKSVSFSSMSQSELEDLYERVKDVLFNLVFKKNMNLEEFLQKLNDF